MKSIFIFCCLVSNLFAVTILNQDIQLRDNINSLDTNVFSIRLDSLSFRDYKYVAINKVPVNISNFNMVVIEATITGEIYAVMLLNQIVYGYKCDSIYIYDIKKFYNDHVKIMENMYGIFDYSNDNNLPYEDPNNININSMMFKFYGNITLYLSITTVGNLITVQITYLDMEVKKKRVVESIGYNERKVRLNLMKKFQNYN